ncbi:hypothetical protein [Aureibacter tunicatorum]|uniref:Preprotein translocase subunit YajC n=1 Tax=Aureibacter tunicatorum TaxID=866807 RepID=A0AAE3XNI8_9BACT|nr:hypothetical protein [Aureibacter tunicatorum]MDR6239765.1 preprotein translocase subunit YajC [Aureibacter tunicatorum]BDD04240.1 hypothetical protein AUTU_17230 [Aureibacter tunicatorum]
MNSIISPRSKIKSAKKILILIVFFSIFFCSNSKAQVKPHHKHTAIQRAFKATRKLEEKLQLSFQQKSKVNDILYDQYLLLIQSPQTNDNKKKKSLHKKLTTELREILDQDQYHQWKKIQKDQFSSLYTSF